MRPSVFLVSPRRTLDYCRHRDYVFGKRTLSELSGFLNTSPRTLQRRFDGLVSPASPKRLFDAPINLVLDATFFSRGDGVLVFRAGGRNLYWRFVESETVAEIARGLDELDKRGYRFKSVTADGRKGVIRLFEARYPGLPVQMCQFHQAQIIRRYLTLNPKTECGQYLKAVMRALTTATAEQFQNLVETWAEIYDDFLKQRNDNGQFKHRRLRSARRSLLTNMPYLLTCKRLPELDSPNTTNSCDGSFAHWKQKLKIHRGLRKHRRNKMIHYLLTQ